MHEKTANQGRKRGARDSAILSTRSQPVAAFSDRSGPGFESQTMIETYEETDVSQGGKGGTDEGGQNGIFELRLLWHVTGP